MQRDGKTLLSRDDWTQAASEALAAGGTRAVSIDRLAKQLGVSRGSFYWHFADRRALVEAAIAQWESRAIERARELPDAPPGDQLRAILRRVYESPVDEIELALASAGDDPIAAAAFARVTATRLDLLRDLFTRLGLPATEVESRVWLLYGFYIGGRVIGRNSDVVRGSAAGLDRIGVLLGSPAPAARRSGAAAAGRRDRRAVRSRR